VMTRYFLLKCKACPPGQDANSLVGCLVQKIENKGDDACKSREKCETDNVRADPSCSARYDLVHTSACTCAKEEFKKGLKALEDWQELKKTFVRGDWQCQFEDCYKQEGVIADWSKPGGMDDRIKEVKAAIIKAYLAYEKGQAPKELSEALFVFKSIIDELAAKWTGVFCGDCSDQKEQNSQAQANNYKNMLGNKDCNAPQGLPPPPPRSGAAAASAAGAAPISGSVASDLDSFFKG